MLRKNSMGGGVDVVRSDEEDRADLRREWRKEPSASREKCSENVTRVFDGTVKCCERSGEEGNVGM